MTLLAVDGAELYYELHGDGPPLVLIHGASGTHMSWWQQVAEFRHRHSCLIYDLRGYGRSRPSGAHDPGDAHVHIRDLEALLRHVGFERERVNLIGASLGSAVAMHYAVDHAAHMNRLVLACGTGCATSETIRAGWQRRRERMAARYREVLEQGSVLPAGVPRVRSAGEQERFSTAYHPFGPVGASLHQDFPALTFLYAEIMASSGGPPTPATFPVFEARAVTAAEAAGFDFPVLVIGGTEDALFPRAELEEVAAMFPHGRAVFFAGSGHLTYYEKPRRFNDLVEGFLGAG